MERIKLNLIPSGVAPIVHLSQYDDGRQFGIDLFEGESVYVLDGTETLTVNSRKPDGHVVTLAVTNTGTSSLDVDTIEQLTAVHGVSYAKLQIVKGSVTIATLPFLIDVSRDPLENGDPSESFIHNLATQISEGVALEVANQYDSANVIFDNAPTSGHGVGYTVTSEGVKTALAGKVDTTDFDATNLPITSGSATNTKDYIDSKTGSDIEWEANTGVSISELISYLLMTEQSDLNSTLNSGTATPRITYYQSTATNKPSGNSGVSITQGNQTYRQQLAIDLEGNIYARFYNNGTISTWVKKA